METKNGFRGDNEVSEDKNLQPQAEDRPQGMTRRGFLGVLGGLAATVISERAGFAKKPKEKFKDTLLVPEVSREQSERERALLREFVEVRSALHEVQMNLFDLKSSQREESLGDSDFSAKELDYALDVTRLDVVYRQRSVEKREHIRAATLESVGAKLDAFLKHLQKYLKDTFPDGVSPINFQRSWLGVHGKSEAASSPYLMVLQLNNALVFSDLQGKTLSCIAELGISPQIFSSLMVAKHDYFAARTADYLPGADDIPRSDIDTFLPENLYLDSLQHAAVPEKKIKRLLSDPAIRDFLIAEPGLTLAGAYSLIKATVEFMEASNEHLPPLRVMEELAKERRAFQEEVLIDKNTAVIQYYGSTTPEERAILKQYPKHEKFFDPAKMAAALKEIGEVRSNTVLEARSDEDKNQKFMWSIGGSRGSTFVYIDMHGLGDRLCPLGVRSDSDFSFVTIADALYNRFMAVLQEQGVVAAAKTLGQVTIVSQACFDYNFLTKLFGYLKEIFKAQLDAVHSGQNVSFGGLPTIDDLRALRALRVRDISMPRMIGLSQKDRVAYGSFGMRIREHAKAFSDAHALRGKDLLLMEPKLYADGNDMSIFSDKGGMLHVISSAEQEANDKIQPA